MNDIIAQTVCVLETGGLVLYPTDTVWGIGCDATNETAVQRIFQLKKRADNKSMIILSASPDDIEPYVDNLSMVHRLLLIDNTIPQTVILPKARRLASSVIPSEQTIAVRCPKHAFCQQLLTVFQKPIVSTSANISGETPPTTLSQINPAILNGVDLIIPEQYDIGSTHQPSRIVKTDENGLLIILRD